MVENVYSPSRNKDEYKTYKCFKQNIRSDKNVICNIEDLKKTGTNPFVANDIQESLLKVHHYIELSIGRRIESFDKLEMSDVIKIQNALGDAWDSSDNT